MYQDRNEDLDPRVTIAINDGPKILKAMEETQSMLKILYETKNNDKDVIVKLGSKYIFGKQNQRFDWIDPDEYEYKDYYGEGWDYSKEFKESLLKLNESVLDAYITFLEAEREALIKRWNDMAKDLKPEKK